MCAKICDGCMFKKVDYYNAAFMSIYKHNRSRENPT